jgi:hypothetical protein
MRGSSTGSNSKRFDTLHREIVGDVFFEVSGVRFQVSGVPPEVDQPSRRQKKRPG